MHLTKKTNYCHHDHIIIFQRFYQLNNQIRNPKQYIQRSSIQKCSSIKETQIETKIARSMKISNEPWESQFKIGQVEGEGLRDGGLEGEG